MANFQKIATTAEIPTGTMKSFRAGSVRIVIVHTKAGFFALNDECSHDSAPISDGHIQGQEIVCARHGARFNLETGAVTAPPAIVPIDTLKLELDGDDILVEIED